LTIFVLALGFGIFLLLTAISARLREREHERLAMRKKFLLDRYRDEHVVDKLLAGSIWRGMSEAQLIDSLGWPDRKEIERQESKTIETLTYRRPRESVRIENGVVVGWTARRASASEQASRSRYRRAHLPHDESA
jgi:hypothetical protein